MNLWGENLKLTMLMKVNIHKTLNTSLKKGFYSPFLLSRKLLNRKLLTRKIDQMLIINRDGFP